MKELRRRGDHSHRRVERARAGSPLAPYADPHGHRRGATARGQEGRYFEAIKPIHQRINEIRPFLLSAAQSGAPDVHAALDQTLASIEASLAPMSVPVAEVGQHQLLISALRVARGGLAPGFSGDRVAQAQKAITMFEGAMAAPVISFAP